jgi:hypothetical protein
LAAGFAPLAEFLKVYDDRSSIAHTNSPLSAFRINRNLTWG